MLVPLSYTNGNPWSGDLWLLTVTELHAIPDGTVVTSIMGNTKVKGLDEIDEDTRFGYVAWGLFSPQFLSEEGA